MMLETYADSVWVTLFAIVLIAGRQHSLYILNHDASHYGLFRSKRINKIVGSLLSNMTMFHHPEAWSFVQWRRVHILHHRYVLSEGDLNYVGRVNM
jgi:fatty acid desaturase